MAEGRLSLKTVRSASVAAAIVLVAGPQLVTGVAAQDPMDIFRFGLSVIERSQPRRVAPPPHQEPREYRSAPRRPAIAAPREPRFDPARVAEAQKLLNARGYEAGPVDGAMGPKTRSAIRAFQRDQGIRVTGQPNAAVLGILRADARLTADIGDSAPFSAPAASFADLGGYDLPLGDYRTGLDEPGLAGISHDSCRSACADDDRCLAYTYNSELSVCMLKDEVNPVAPVEVAHSGIKVVNPTFVALEASNTVDDRSDLADRPPEPSVSDLADRPTALSGSDLVAPALPGASPAVRTTAEADEATTSAAAVSKDYAALARQYGLHTARGLPVIAASRSILTDEQAMAAADFLDHVELALEPGLLDERAMCWAASQPKAVADEYLLSGTDAARSRSPSQHFSHKSGLFAWKGEDEFQRERTEQAFLANHRASLAAKAIAPPLEVLIIDELELPPYDRDAGGFALPFDDLNSYGATLSIFQAYYGVNSTRPPCSNRDFEFSPAAAALPEFWAMDVARAEEIVNRLSERKAYAAFTLRFRSMPLAKRDNSSRPSDRMPLASDILSVALYEDPDLERPIETLVFPKAREPLLLSGVPESPRFADTMSLDEEALALILLRDHGDVLDDEAWRLLMQRQADHDKAYYMRKEEASSWAKENEQYADDHVPFFPIKFDANFRGQFPEPMVTRFKEWAMLRARNLPEEMILHTTVAQQRGNPATLHLPIAKDTDRSGLIAALLDKGHSVDQILRLDMSGSGSTSFDDSYLGDGDVVRKAVAVLPNIAMNYMPAMTDEDKKRIGSRAMSGAVEMTVRIGASEIISIDDELQAFALEATPTLVRSTDRDSGEVIYEHRYEVAPLDRGRLDVSGPISPPEGEALPLTAETMDLLTVKHLPEFVKDSDFHQMMMARWAYEASIAPGRAEPDWGRFFVPGRPKPDEAQQAEMLPRYRKWTVDRAAALPEKISLQYDSVRLAEGAPISVFSRNVYGLGGTDGNGMNALKLSCENRARTHNSVRPACGYLQNVYDNTPAIYPFGVGDKLAGPRLACRAVLRSGAKDVYCDARQAQFDKLSSTAFDPGFREVMVLDKEVYFPGTQSEAVALRSGMGMRVDIAVKGATIADKPLPIPIVEAMKRYSALLDALGISGSGWRIDEEAPSGTYLMFDAEVLSARLVETKTEKLVRGLDLRPARSPDLEALAMPDQPSASFDKPIGPDVVGLRLGMTVDEADEIIRSHMAVGRVLIRDRSRQSEATTGDFEDYSSSRIYVAEDDSEFIIVYDEPPSLTGVVVGVTRQINFDQGQMTAAAALAQLRSKYGQEDWSGDGSVGWGEGLRNTTTNDSITHRCIPSTGNTNIRAWIEEDNQPTQWKSPSAHAIPNINLYNDVRGRNCGPILRMQFDEMNSPTASDRLVLQLTDPSNYQRLLDESRRLVKSGEATIGADISAPAMKL